MTKAVWLMEQAYRKEKTGSTEHEFSTVEEADCLSNLLETYALYKKKRGGEEPELERLQNIISEGYMTPFVNFEIFGLKVPHFSAVHLNEKERREVRDYIEKCVLTPDRRAGYAVSSGNEGG
jgi:hypothetical protein